MADRERTPDQVPIDRPSAARMYDYFLGGAHNFDSDRKTAERAISIYPQFPLIMRANRAFLRRVVRYLVAHGIDQFLDLGSGIPTVGNVHEVAQAADPNARVLYVDIDPVAIAHSTALLHDNTNAHAIRADIRQPEALLEQVRAQQLIDFSRPFAVLLVFVLHFVSDDAMTDRIVKTLRSALSPGSYLVISHSTGEGTPADAHAALIRLYRHSSNPVTSRLQDYLVRWFEGMDLVEPGVVRTPLWHPESPEDLYLDHPERASSCAGVARQPQPHPRLPSVTS
ncbi:MAG: SAM-dependent methyltransferase [Chloroflexi bacterium]|nr:SAM-dependent methyltransferase [Chloroflexota bacterium]